MKEKNAELGVLTYGREPEEFTKDAFKESCLNVLRYLMTNGVQRKRNGEAKVPAEGFLRKRNLLDPGSQSFALSSYSVELYDYSSFTKPGENNNIKPFILFSACPKILEKDIEVNSKEVSAWIQSNEYVLINNKQNKAPFLRQATKKLDLDSIVFRSTLGYSNVVNYLELQQNGFVEQGLTYPIIRSVKINNNSDVPILHLSWLTGAWWTFLTFCRDYYEYVKLDGEIEFFLSIHNSRALALIGFNGVVDDKGSRWIDPT
jgi:hypothetical protein